MTTTKTFSLYLGKPGVESLDDVLTDGARDLIKAGVAKRVSSGTFGEENALFTFPGQRVTPKWVGHLSASFAVPAGLVSQAPCAIVVFKMEGRFFAITFSYGHVFLDEAKTEAEFGLKVAINKLSDDKLRSVEHSNIGDAIRGFSQAAGQRDLKSFGFDEALDLIRKVSGYARDDDFADVVTGARALRFSKKMELDEVPDTAVEALRLFGLKTYKDTAFKIIDFLAPVLDVQLIDDLDAELVRALSGNSDEFEIAIPAILPTGVGSFGFVNAGIRGGYPDLSVQLYRDGLGNDLAALDIDQLKKHKIAVFSEAGEKVDQWSVHRALVGSLVLSDGRYALNEGAWYRLDWTYKDAADQKFAQLLGAPDLAFTPLKKIIPPHERGKQPKSYYQSEGSYNADIAASSGYLLMGSAIDRDCRSAGPTDRSLRSSRHFWPPLHTREEELAPVERAQPLLQARG